MSKPIEILMKEHRLIEEILASLAVFAEQSALESEENRRTAAQFAEFFREFADRRHHGKEEALLFTELERQGMPSDSGPIGVMLEEHEIGRRCVGMIASIADGKGPLQPEEQAKLRAVVSEYVAMLGAHIQKEDGVLFPMAERLLDEGSQDQLEARFEEFEQREIGDGAHKRLNALAQSLTHAWK